MNHKYLWQQFACRTGHKPAARLFHIIPARFFDVFLKMVNWEFRMKIILGEAFFNEIVLSWEGGRIYNPLRTVKEKNSCSQGKCRSLYGYWNVTPLQHATNSIKEGLPKFYFRPGYRSNFPYSRHQGEPRQISVLRKRPWYVKKRRCKFFSLRVTAWLRIVNPLEKGVPIHWFNFRAEGERWMPVLTILWRNSFVNLQEFSLGMHEEPMSDFYYKWIVKKIEKFPCGGG